jgi:hypothetical protein
VNVKVVGFSLLAKKNKVKQIIKIDKSLKGGKGKKLHNNEIKSLYYYCEGVPAKSYFTCMHNDYII